jgi:hypothetical protein
MKRGLWVLLLISCAHAPEPSAESSIAAPRCSVVSSVAAMRVKKPAPRACGERQTMQRECTSGAAPACYQVATCLSGELFGTSSLSATEKKEYLDATTASLAVACREGVSEACVLRAGVQQETGTPARETCEDLVRACQLGDEVDGCIACIKAGC